MIVDVASLRNNTCSLGGGVGDMLASGNIDLVEGKFVRFSASGGAIWHRTKQVV